MATKATLSDLRNAIAEIYRDIMHQGGWEAANAAVLAKLKDSKARELDLLAPQLIDMALIKLLNEVSSRRRRVADLSETRDLFGEYRVPRNITIARGKKKDTAKLTFREAEIYLEIHAVKPASKRHEQLRRLVEACRKHVQSEQDTLETLINRANDADQDLVRSATAVNAALLADRS
jgi:hypothetical protein